jgi:hypothetical protein
MPFSRLFSALAVSGSLLVVVVLPAIAAHLPIGILTLASHAKLGESTAFPGLSVFDGERLVTEADGRLALRAGHSYITLGEKTEAELIQVDGGVHVDMNAGSVHFSSAASELVEVHTGDAIIRPASAQATQALVTLVGLKVLQITAEHGNSSFSYRDELRNLPEGQTYRIYLDARSEADTSASGTQPASAPGRLTYFFVGAGAAGGAAWGIEHALRSGNAPISPAKP